VIPETLQLWYRDKPIAVLGQSMNNISVSRTISYLTDGVEITNKFLGMFPTDLRVAQGKGSIWIVQIVGKNTKPLSAITDARLWTTASINP
jgi:hypothetical protein